MDDLFSLPIPLGVAAAYFIAVKQAAAPCAPDPAALDEFWCMPREEQRELLKEAGVTADEFGALLKFADEAGDLKALVAEEQQGAAAQQMNEAEFYRQKAQAVQGELAAQQEQLTMKEQQLQALQQQVDGSTAQMQQLQQQAQLTQQASLTNVQAAHAAATQATQQALTATDEALKNKQLAAQMRMEYQGLRGQVMDVVSQDPAAGIGAQLSGAGLDTQAPPQDPSAAAPAAGPPMGDPAAPPVPPEPAAPPAGPATAGAPPAQAPEAAAPKEAAASMRERLPYMVGGGVLGGIAGGVGTALEARGGHDDLRAKVQQLQAAPGGFRQAIDLAKAKAQLATGEISEKHPGRAILAGSLVGAGLGGAAGPELVEQGTKFFGRLAGRQ